MIKYNTRISKGVNAVKNRYCLFCGTLLPEDGVCLRCGAKHELAESGQLKAIPRKVKRVVAKPAAKKRIVVKIASDLSKAETQTIPIPEDVFSFSEEAKREEKHADWTGDSAQHQKKEEPEYVPNFVLQDEPISAPEAAPNNHFSAFRICKDSLFVFYGACNNAVVLAPAKPNDYPAGVGIGD